MGARSPAGSEDKKGRVGELRRACGVPFCVAVHTLSPVALICSSTLCTPDPCLVVQGQVLVVLTLRWKPGVLCGIGCRSARVQRLPQKNTKMLHDVNSVLLPDNGVCAWRLHSLSSIFKHVSLLRQAEVDALRRLLSERLGWDADVSELGDEEDEDAPVVVEL